MSADSDKGRRKIKKVPKKGDHTQNMSLGTMYYKGIGVKQDFVKAYSYLCVAEKFGDSVAEKHLKEVLLKMTPEQIQEGKKEAEKMWNGVLQKAQKKKQQK